MLHFKKLGSGKPVFILHGFLGMSDNWLSVGKQLAETHCVYLIDQRNHGRSPHFDAHSYALMAADLLEVMEEEGLDSVSLIGHSMGGKTAMHFALTHPDRVDQLVVVDIAPGKTNGSHQYILDALLAIDFKTISSRKDVEEQLAKHISEAGVRLFLMKNLHRQGDGSYQWRMNLPVLSQQYDAINVATASDAKFQGPTLFLRGGESNYIKTSDEERINTLFPKAQIQTIKDAGHWVHAEQPQATIDALVAFL